MQTKIKMPFVKRVFPEMFANKIVEVQPMKKTVPNIFKNWFKNSNPIPEFNITCMEEF